MKVALVLLLGVAVLLAICDGAQAHGGECSHVIAKAKNMLRALVRHRRLLRRTAARHHSRRYQARVVRMLRIRLHQLRRRHRQCFSCQRRCRGLHYKLALLRRLLSWIRREESQLSHFSRRFGGNAAKGKRYKSVLQVHYEYMKKRMHFYKARLARCKSSCHRN